jgi:hypothetical protein
MSDVEIQWMIGRFLGYLVVFVWIPLAAFTAGKAAMGAFVSLLPTIPSFKTKTAKKKFPDKTPKKDPIPDRAKKPKQAYSVTDSYSDEYKITNPVNWED